MFERAWFGEHSGQLIATVRGGFMPDSGPDQPWACVICQTPHEPESRSVEDPGLCPRCRGAYVRIAKLAMELLGEEDAVAAMAMMSALQPRGDYLERWVHESGS